jgi:hypothetical protein
MGVSQLIVELRAGQQAVLSVHEQRKQNDDRDGDAEEQKQQ